MCFSSKMPTPKAPPPAPNPNMATLAAAAAQRADSVRQSSASNIIARLRDDDVAASAKKTRLGQ
jgi:hypothetical protein